MGVVAAVLAGGVAAGVGGSVFGGMMGSSAEKKRAINLYNAGQRGIQYIGEGSDRALAEGNAKLNMARGDLSPFRDMGQEAGTTLADLLMGRRSAAGMLKASDLFNFQSDLGTRNINRELAARGMYGSGAGLETLARFNNQLVGEEGQRLVDRLFSLTGLGANAAGNMAGITNQTGNNLADMLYRTGIDKANMHYTAAGGAANATANAQHIMGNMGKESLGIVSDGLLSFGSMGMGGGGGKGGGGGLMSMFSMTGGSKGYMDAYNWNPPTNPNSYMGEYNWKL